MGERAFLVDMTKCTGCGLCQISCKDWNDIPAEETGFYLGEDATIHKTMTPLTWSRVAFHPEKSGLSMFHQKCYHCGDPLCLKVCPEKAICKSEGWVIIDQEKCIGCAECEGACPYSAVHVAKRDYSPVIKKKKAYKCHGCVLNSADEPACSRSCPTGALKYGYRLKLIKEGEKRVSELKKIFPNANLYGIREHGGLNVLTILKGDARNYSIERNSDISRALEIRNVYRLFSFASGGNSFVKKRLYTLSRIVAGDGRKS